MPSKSPEALERKRLYDRDRKRQARENEAVRERERIERAGRRRIDTELRRARAGEWSDDWVLFDWENGFIAKRAGNQAYRPWLERLHLSDLQRHTVRLNVYETTPLTIELRKEMPRVWQTNRSATIQVPGAPLIKRFKVLDPKEVNPIPIGEGELVRRYLGGFAKGRRIFPKSAYHSVTDAPLFFVPQGPTDLMEFEVEYVDIARCYSQLLERLPSLAVNFSYGRRTFDPITDLPQHDPALLLSKHWGRATVGMLRQRLGRCFIYGEPKLFPSRFYHADTSNWVHAILHGLASYAINECGCFRWHTDGGFFPKNGGYKFARLLNSLGIDHSLDEFAAVLFASLDQYEGIYQDGRVKQTKSFLSTYIDDYIFLPASAGGAQRDNVIHGLNLAWLFSTLERER